MPQIESPSIKPVADKPEKGAGEKLDLVALAGWVASEKEPEAKESPASSAITKPTFLQSSLGFVHDNVGLSPVVGRESFCVNGAEFAKTATLFLPGKGYKSYIGTAGMYALDSAKVGDSADVQAMDAFLGGLRGAGTKGVFSLSSSWTSPIAKGLTIGLTSRALEVGLNRENFLNPVSHKFDSERLGDAFSTQVLNTKLAGADVLAFTVGELAFRGLNFASGKKLADSRFLSTVLSGGSFGFVNGFNAELADDLTKGRPFDLTKALSTGAFKAGLDAAAAIPGGLIGARIARHEHAAKTEELKLTLKDQHASGRDSLLVETQPAARPTLAELTSRLQVKTNFAELLYAKPVPEGGYKGLDDFMRNGLEMRPTTVREHKIKGTNTVIVVPEAYARELDNVRRVRQAIESDSQGVQKGPVDVDFNLLNRALPEDLVPMLARLPNPDLVRRVILRNEANPADVKHAIEAGDKSFQSAASGDKRGDINLYRYDLHPGMQRDINHEWAHLLKYAAPLHSQMFDLGAKVEEFGSHERGRALVNDHENWAVHLGEVILSGDKAKAMAFAEQAPLRALVMAGAIKESIRLAPTTEANAETLKLVEAILNQVREPAIRSLTATAQDAANPEYQQSAAKLLLYLGEGTRLNGANGPQSLSFANEGVFGNAHAAQLGNWKWLTTVDVSGTGIDRAGVRPLIANASLTDLSLARTRINDIGLCSLPSVLTLRSVNLAGNAGITDGATGILSSMRGLTHLDVSNTRMTPAGVDKLRLALPTTEIIGGQGSN